MAAVVAVVVVAAMFSGGDEEPRDEVAGEGEQTQVEADAETADDDVKEDDVEEDVVETKPEEPEKSVVPKVVDARLQRATTLLRRADLATRVVRRPSWRPVGTVLEQRVRAGAKLLPGKTVVLVVAAAMPRVPGVVGRPAQVAVEALRAAGFKVSTVEQTVSSGVGGVVLRQTPAGTAQAEPGSLVTVVVSHLVRPLAPPAPAPTNCTPGYSPCLPPAPDYDCAGGSGDGPKYTGLVHVNGSDPYGLDADGDGVACGGD